MRYLALITILCATTLHAQEEPKLYTNQELLESVDDATASELRWLLQGGRISVGLTSQQEAPVQRAATAFERLLATGDVDLFIRIAHAENVVAAAYGAHMIRTLHPERLPELLTYFITRTDRIPGVSYDVGCREHFLDFALWALDELSPTKDAKTFEACFDTWFDRLLSGDVTEADWNFGHQLVHAFGPRRARLLEFADEAKRDLLKLVPGLTEWEYLTDELYPMPWEELPADSHAGKVALQMFVLSWPKTRPLEAIEKVIANEELERDDFVAIRVEAERIRMADRSNVWDRVAPAIIYTEPMLTDEQCSQALEKALPELKEGIRVITDYWGPQPKLAENPPEDERAFQEWAWRLLNTDEDERATRLDAALAEQPERALWLDHPTPGALIWEDAGEFSWRDDGKLPHHLLPFAKSGNRVLRTWFYHVLRFHADGLNKRQEEEPEYVEALLEIVRADARRDDIYLRWMARDVLFEIEFELDRTAAIAKAWVWMPEYCADLVANPKQAAWPAAMMWQLQIEWYDLWDEREEKGMGRPEIPAYDLAVELAEVWPEFQDRADELEWKTLKEIREEVQTPEQALTTTRQKLAALKEDE